LFVFFTYFLSFYFRGPTASGGKRHPPELKKLCLKILVQLLVKITLVSTWREDGLMCWITLWIHLFHLKLIGHTLEAELWVCFVYHNLTMHTHVCKHSRIFWLFVRLAIFMKFLWSFQMFLSFNPLSLSVSILNYVLIFLLFQIFHLRYLCILFKCICMRFLIRELSYGFGPEIVIING